jgi:ribonuclease PH
MPSPRLDGRAPLAIRPLVFRRRWLDTVPGSVLVECGLTRVLCTAVVEDGVPPFLKNSDQGWLTAEYAMVPASTGSRKSRDRSGRTDGRSVEIQRLLGRALRAVVDRGGFPARTVWIDCDVLQADGGTRCAALNGAYVALHDALSALKQQKALTRWPLKDSLQAISVGIVEGETRVDLTYYEDSNAEVDLNLVLTGSGRVIEINGGAERAAFTVEQMGGMVEAGQVACAAVARAQQAALDS